MTQNSPSRRQDTRLVSKRRLLMAGVSVFTLMVAASAAQAGALSSAISNPTGPVSATTNATTTATIAAQQAATATVKVTTDLASSAKSLRSALAAQAAARAAGPTSAAALAVTDGLSPNGLVVDPRTDPTLWVNISKPVETTATSNGTTTYTETLTQTSQRAIATWDQFNVGKNTTVYFNQSAGNASNGNNWVVLNRIDATGSPSQILGKIKAEGTVLIINPNGIVFGGGSQVNVHSLIASAMDISGASNVSVYNASGAYKGYTVNGLTFQAPTNESSGNSGFLTSGLYANNVSGSSSGPTSLILATGNLPSGQTNQGVVVQSGATISTDVSGFDNGGTVALLGPQVVNAGLIETSAGQIILAAGYSATITQPSSTTGSATNFSVSVNSVPAFPNAAPSGSSLVTNESDAGGTGVLLARRGNITLAGDLVNQNGVIDVTTSVTRPGSVTINANQLLTFGGHSVTTIRPDENGEKIPSDAKSLANFIAPSITIAATNMDVQGTAQGGPGALIVAPGAAMTVATTTGVNCCGVTVPVGRAFLETGSVIDLGGLSATASVADYLYTFKVTANDVADTPLARSLIGQTVTIDLRLSGTRADGENWVGSPLFASSGAGYLTNIPKTIDQLLTKGGSLTFAGTSLSSAPFQDVIQAPGSLVNISGGAMVYGDASVTTSNVLTALGGNVNIGSADPFVLYTGLPGTITVEHVRAGTSDTYFNKLAGGTTSSYDDPGYGDGISAGSLSVAAGNPILEGAIQATTWTSSRQTQLAQIGTGTSGTQVTPDQLPQGGALTIAATALNNGADVIVLRSAVGDVLGSNFTMGSALNLPTVDLVTGVASVRDPVTYVYTQVTTVTTLPELFYSTDVLSAGGFGSITIVSASSVSMEKGAVLKVADGGSIKLGSVTALDGSLIAHGGKIEITGFTNGTYWQNAPPTSAVIIGADARLDVSGLWVNDRGASGDTIQGPTHINGGSVTIQTYAEGTGTQYENISDTTQGIVLAAGSVIDLSSGGYVQPNGQIKTAASGLPAGNGGNLSLLTYAHNPGNPRNGWGNPIFNFNDMDTSGNLAPAALDGSKHPNQANVVMNGTIYSGGLASGGTFTLQVPTIQIGGVSAVISHAASSAQAGEIDLPASFFSSNGFSTYALTSTYGSVTVIAGTKVLLQQKSYQLPTSGELPETGAHLSDFATLGLAADGLRQAVNLSLTQQPFAYGDLPHLVHGKPADPTDLSVNAGILVDTGAAIIGDPKAAISLTAGGPVTMLGSLVAPGGSIALTNNGGSFWTTFLSQGQAESPGLTQAPLDVWIGAQAVLDVSGTYVPNPLVTTYRTGAVLDGGSITISGGTIVAMPGSTFDLAGTSATVEQPGAVTNLGNTGLALHQVWSNGGTLTLNTSTPLAWTNAPGIYGILYFDGAVNATGGGPLASGGALVIKNYTSMIITQNGSVTAGLSSSTLATNGAYPANFNELQTLLPSTDSRAYITAYLLNNSGFGSVSLMADKIAFSGNVIVQVPGALTLAGNLTLLPTGITDPSITAPSIGSTMVNVNAGSLLLVGNSGVTPVLSDGTLNLNATAEIDLAGIISVSNAANVNLTSGGDIRLLAETNPQFAQGFFGTNPSSYFGQILSSLSQLASQSTIQTPGLLQVADNLTLIGREVFPETNSAFVLMSRGLGSGAGTINTISIAPNGKTPVAPLSANGAILIDAPTIKQAGALMAPLGTIQLGFNAGQTLPSMWRNYPIMAPNPVVTASVTLASGSLTSVSAAGLDIPFGTTVNGTNWSGIDQGLADYIVVQKGTPNFPAMTAPPTKSITFNGSVVTNQVGAVVDVSGGGDIHATEFVAGTGGSRNLLLQSSVAKGQTVYALLPSYAAAVAASDPLYGQIVAAGTSVTLAGGNGIAAGTYVLLPASYATVPGAYRVVVTKTDTGNSNPLSTVMPDGSILMTGTLGNAITGARSSQTALLQIQSSSVWSQYSEVDITHANRYFPTLAAKAGTSTPILPIDGGTLQLNATSALTLAATYTFAPAAGGRGGEVDIAGNNLLVLASDLTAPASDVTSNYIVLDSDQLSHLGATTLVLGGVSSFGSNKAGVYSETITATASNLEIETDAAHPLTAPDLVLITKPLAGANGLTVDAGSVVRAVGKVPTTSGIATNFGSGSMVRVANGVSGIFNQTGTTAAGVSVAIGTGPGTAALAATPGVAVTIDGNLFALYTSGASAMAANTILQARNYDLSGNVINLGAVPTAATGLTISPVLIAAFAGADSVRLHSAAGIDFFGAVQLGNAAAPIGLLTLDGSGLYGDGGTVGISASAITLTNSQSSAAGTSLGAGGSLTLDSTGAVTVGAGTKVLDGFSTVGVSAGQSILFAGSGSLDAGAATVTLAAPDVVVAAASSQSLTTTGQLTLLPGTGTMPVVSTKEIGGSLALTGGSITDSGLITALAGKVLLTATNGGIELTPGAKIRATGSHIVLFDATEDAPGGIVKLIATKGNVAIDTGATVDVSATGSGYAGTIVIQTAKSGTATLNGTLNGGAAYNDLGGNFVLSAGSLIGTLPINSGFTGSFQVSLQNGDITVSTGQTLTSGTVVLVADGGSVTVDGTIDASGPSGGSIALYGSGVGGSGGVNLTSGARLLATYRADDVNDPAYASGASTLVQTGGTITLGTTGTPTGGTDSTYGYEQVAQSGAINVATGAILDVSGGAGGANINNAGGTILIRAPILIGGNVNVSFKGNVISSGKGGPSGNGVVLDAYAVWSTADGSGRGKHFDGIIDPAGWFANDGTSLPGLDQNGYAVNAPTPTAPLPTGSLFTPTTPNDDHKTFYQQTLVGFVQSGLDAATLAGDFAGATGVNLGTTLHLRPGIDLTNPSSTINKGNITVASNWNLGAGVADTTGKVTLYYRTTNATDPGEPGQLNLLAANNVQVNATISDGFFSSYQATTLPTINSGTLTTPGTVTIGIPNVAIQAYQSELVDSDYRTYSPYLDSNGDYKYSYWANVYTISDIFGGYIDLSLIGPATLQAPAVFSSGNANVIDQYNQSYAGYVGLFKVYVAEMNYNSGGFVPPSSLGASAPADLPPSAPTSTSAWNYATPGTGYMWQYAQYLVDTMDINQAGTFSLKGLSSVSALLKKLTNVSQNDGCWPCVAYAAPFAPYYTGTGPSTTVISGTTLTLGDTSSLPVVQPSYVVTPSVISTTPPVGFTSPTLSTAANAAQTAAALAMMQDAIANNPGVDLVLNPQYVTATSADLMPVGFTGSKGSFSYDFVGGADLAGGSIAADPHAVITVPAGIATTGITPSDSVTLNGHTSYINPQLNSAGKTLTVDVPTVVRTGTGSITITAAGSFELLDADSPGAVYTAGAAVANAADFTPPTVATASSLPAGQAGATGLFTTPVWATNGGSVMIVVGSDIVGIETPSDTDGSRTGVKNASTAEFWSGWYYRAGSATGSSVPFDSSAIDAWNNPYYQNSAWVNYGTFFQGIGALGGGNVTLKAGKDIVDVSASLPETIQVSGGTSATGPAATAHYYGGGTLVVQAGGDLASSAFYVGRGTGVLSVGGNVTNNLNNPVTGAATQFQPSQVDGQGDLRLAQGNPVALPLMLAVQDGHISIDASGSITVGGVFDPAALPFDIAVNVQRLNNAYAYLFGIQTNSLSQGIVPPGFGASFSTYGASSGLSLLAVSGDMTVDILSTISGFLTDTRYASGSLTLPASVQAEALLGNMTLPNGFTLTPSSSGTITLMAGGSITSGASVVMLDPTTTPDITSYTTLNASLLGTAYPTTLSRPLHADDVEPVIIYAGGDLTGTFVLLKPAKIEAGHDIVNTSLVSENNGSGDITSVIAGNDILARRTTDSSGTLIDGASVFALYGPGTLLVQAGRDLGPFLTNTADSSQANWSGIKLGGITLISGIQTLGDGSNFGTSAVKSYLPAQGADIHALFGVGGGMDANAAIAAYVDPTVVKTDGIDFLPDIAAILGLGESQTWAAFQTLSPIQKRLLVQRAFLDFLTQVNHDYSNAASPYAGQYARAYQAIATLFPASLGYTANNGGSNGAAVTVKTGDLYMARSLIESQAGGDINILGPGGNMYVGANASDKLTPSQQGILTLQGGSIRTYTDGDAQVYQSRIFTEQGGDVDMFSANGDLNAGKGPKSSSAYPPLVLTCDVDGYCRVNPAGLVTGAGVGALISLAGQDPTLSNVVLSAPHGTVDAGAAGIRAAGNLNIVALHVLNAFNISVGGTVTGVPMAVTPTVNLGALAAENTAGQASGAAEAAARSSRQTGPRNSDMPSIITVEVIGYGGGDGTQGDQEDGANLQGKKRGARYDQSAPVQVYPGTLDPTQIRQ